MNYGLNKGKNIKMFLFILPALAFFTVIKLIPAVMGIVYSFTNWNGINPTKKFIGIENFKELFASDPDFWVSMGLTLKYVVIIVILMNLTALLLAVMIENLRRGKGIFRTIFYLPNMISMIIGGFMWKFVFTQVLYKLAEKTGMKFLDQSWIGDPKYAFWSIIAVAIWGGAGYLMVIYIAAIQSVPTYLYEAAIVDGASRMRRFWSITLPMIRNSITICLFVTLNSAFQVFDVVYSLTGGGPGGATQVVAINIYKEAFARSNRFGYATAKSTIVFLIVLIVTFIQLKVTQRKEVEA
jgi:raffinose/stachyose/melibiose transport system permease protein